MITIRRQSVEILRVMVIAVGAFVAAGCSQGPSGGAPTTALLNCRLDPVPVFISPAVVGSTSYFFFADGSVLERDQDSKGKEDGWFAGTYKQSGDVFEMLRLGKTAKDNKTWEKMDLRVEVTERVSKTDGGFRIVRLSRSINGERQSMLGHDGLSCNNMGAEQLIRDAAAMHGVVPKQYLGGR